MKETDKIVARCVASEDMKRQYPDIDQRTEMCLAQATADMSGIAAADYMFCFKEFGFEEEVDEDNFYVPSESEYVSADEVHYEENEIEEWDIAAEKPGLWENIRKKKEREGKNYRPAKPGDKDRPSKESWKRAQSGEGEAEGAEYQGRKVKLGKPFRTPDGPKKFSVYVKNDKGNVVKVNFGDPNMSIKKNIPERRKSFRARHNCQTPGPKWKSRYWACRSW